LLGQPPGHRRHCETCGQEFAEDTLEAHATSRSHMTAIWQILDSRVSDCVDGAIAGFANSDWMATIKLYGATLQQCPVDLIRLDLFLAPTDPPDSDPVGRLKTIGWATGALAKSARSPPSQAFRELRALFERSERTIQVRGWRHFLITSGRFTERPFTVLRT
jgi:hypothetical protein